MGMDWLCLLHQHYAHLFKMICSGITCVSILNEKKKNMYEENDDMIITIYKDISLVPNDFMMKTPSLEIQYGNTYE